MTFANGRREHVDLFCFLAGQKVKCKKGGLYPLCRYCLIHGHDNIQELLTPCGRDYVEGVNTAPRHNSARENRPNNLAGKNQYTSG